MQSGDQSCIQHKQLNCPDCCAKRFLVHVSASDLFEVEAKSFEEAQQRAQGLARMHALTIDWQVDVIGEGKPVDR